MKYAYDLHIHSVLSPCADDLMTPNNILNMAMLNKLDFIAVTDHNSLKNLSVLNQIAESYDFVFVPGVEVQVEDGHVLCYFKSVETALDFDKFLEEHLEFKHSTDRQAITDIYDNNIAQVYYYLITNVDIDLNTLLKEVKLLDGIVILSHLNRSKYSTISLINDGNIGYIDAIELTKNCNVQEFLLNNPSYANKKIFINSDSHQIIELSQRTNFIELEEKTIEAFFKYFNE